jgi:hypothetical protein
MATASPTAQARALAKSGKIQEAERAIARLIADNFAIGVTCAKLNYDWTSLNSLNGTVRTDDGEFFFKLHQEEGEEETVAEYYRGELLRRSGYDVDVPVRVCRDTGRQILLYRVRREKTLAATLLAIRRGEADMPNPAALVVAQREFDARVAEIYLCTLHEADPAKVADEPIHRLFHARLCEPERPDTLGGRAVRFYEGRSLEIAGASIAWRDFATARWIVNGVEYADTLDTVFARALRLLEPRRLARFGAVVAHGDAHNANIWVERQADAARLVMFDPAFAGTEIPALLAEVKATVHNIFAHPFWLYHPAEAGGHFDVHARYTSGMIALEHDWRLDGILAAFLESKRDLLWRPLLTAMKMRGLLPDDWRETLRVAFFACPTLVLNLLGDVTKPRPADVVLMSFALSLAMGGAPIRGRDIFADFIDGIAP